MIVYYIGFGILIFAAIFFIGRIVKKLSSNVIKIINWISFGIGALSAILYYYKGDEIYKYILLSSIVVYFLFYNYDSKKG